jgi:DNA-binding NarL/FixJ family response regulator
MPRSRIILADDHNLLLDAFRLILEPHFDVVATFADGKALLEGVRALNPDVIVSDIGMPVMNGLNAGQRIKQILPKVKLIFLTVNDDPALVAEAFRSGASGYLVKNVAASELVHAIREVLLGRSYLTPLITKDMIGSLVGDSTKRKPLSALTLRQKEVLQLLAEGRSMKEAAHLLHLAPRTVAFHKYTMMNQLQLKNNAELVQFAMRTAIVPT